MALTGLATAVAIACLSAPPGQARAQGLPSGAVCDTLAAAERLATVLNLRTTPPGLAEAVERANALAAVSAALSKPPVEPGRCHLPGRFVLDRDTAPVTVKTALVYASSYELRQIAIERLAATDSESAGAPVEVYAVGAYTVLARITEVV